MTPALRDLRTICAAPYGFWLDTALTGRAPDEASYYGAEPFLVLRSFGETVELWTRGSTDRFTASPFTVLRDLLRQHRGRSGGAAGYLAYDLKRHVERLPETAVDELGLPECHLAFYERIDRFDPRPLSVEASAAPRHSPLDDTAGPPQSNFTRKGYEAAVERALDYIRAGARVITVNAYSATRDRLEPHGFGDRFEELQRRACELALRARDESGEEVAIAGCLPPLMWSYRPDLAGSSDQTAAIYAEIARLQAPHVDLILCETMSSADQGLGAVRGALEGGGAG